MLMVCDEAPQYFHVSNITIKPRSMTAFTTSLQENNHPSDPAQESCPASGLPGRTRLLGFVPPGVTWGVSTPETSSPSVTVFASK